MRTSSRDAETNAPPRNLKFGDEFYQGKGSVVESGPRVFEKCYPWVFKETQATNAGGKALRATDALKHCRMLFATTHRCGGRVWIVGNGGSAAIASHIAVDLTKNGGVRSMAFNDAATLTCLANDFGYPEVFAKQIETQARNIDAVVIVSTSGKSLNILRAADAARVLGCSIITLSGMNPNNVLRKRGDVNLYVPSSDYGVVETAHLILLHSVVTP